MKDVKLERKVLLAKVRANRAAHKKEYDEAMVGYREEVIKVAKAQLAKAMERENVDKYSWPNQPKEYLREYDRVIAMCEASVDDHITLSANDFGRYMMDDWEWSDSFKAGTSSYSSRN